MIIYLTFNDTPSGIYSSQVIDVVKFFRAELKQSIKLVAFISLRGFFKNRKKIKQEMTDALVVPMYPGIANWRVNKYFLSLLLRWFKVDKVIGRSVIATNLAMLSKAKKVIYDGRGAIGAEWREYSVVTHPTMLNEIDELESNAVINSHYRIAVSQQLVNYWHNHFNYKQENHVVIPCTINKQFEDLEISEKNVIQQRNKLGYQSDDIVMVYSGSVAAWQSFELILNFATKTLHGNPKLKFLFLSDINTHVSELIKAFPNRVSCFKVAVHQVPQILMACDYGLLIREDSVTNQVASPVKFAEYLACGLKVIISPKLGDFSDFVLSEQLGVFYNSITKLKKPEILEKTSIQNLAIKKFSKHAFLKHYQSLVNLN